MAGTIIVAIFLCRSNRFHRAVSLIGEIYLQIIVIYPMKHWHGFLFMQFCRFVQKLQTDISVQVAATLIDSELLVSVACWSDNCTERQPVPKR